MATFNQSTNVYTVPYDELYAFVQSLDSNTIETSYKIEVTNIESSMRELNRAASGKFVDYSPTVLPETVETVSFYTSYLTGAPVLPKGIKSLSYAFEQCPNLQYPPEIPEGVTDMTAAFLLCYNLKKTPVIPNTVTTMKYCFGDCFSLEEITNIPSSVKDIESCFQSCTSLKCVCNWDYNEVLSYYNAFSGCDALEYMSVDGFNATTITNLSNFLANLKTEGQLIDSFDLTKIYYGTLFVEVPFSQLDDYFENAAPTTIDNPCRLKITGLTASDDLNEKITNGPCFCDLSNTELPSDLTRMYKYFYRCTNLVVPPPIPEQVTMIDWAFRDCTNLKAVAKPHNNITSMAQSYRNCSLIEEAFIPGSVTNILCTFSGCSNLKKVTIDYNALDTYDSAFSGCNSLERINLVDSDFDKWTNLVNILNTMQTETGFPTTITPSDIVYYTYIGEHTVSFANLENYLKHIDQNTEETAYKLNITGLTTGNLTQKSSSITENLITTTLYHSDLSKIFFDNRNKYVDISSTVLPSGTKTMTSTFSAWDSLQSYPLRIVGFPELPTTVTNIQSCFRGNEYIKQLRIRSTVTDISYAFQDCVNLEKIFVFTEEERQNLISLMSAEDFFADKDLNTIVETLKKGIVNVKTEDGVFTAEIYPDECFLQKTDTQPIKLAKNKKVYYMQTVGQKFLADCKNKGSGTLLKTLINDEPVFVACTAGSFEEPFVKPYDTTEGSYFEITDSTELIIPKEWFGSKGAVMLVCSGKGSGDLGGNGYIHRIEFPSDIKEDIIVNISFIINSNANGLKGNDTGTFTGYYCAKTESSSPHYTCHSRSEKGYGKNGYSAGANIVVQIGEKVTTVYGGGGQGGLGGSITYNSNCGTSATSHCIPSNKKTSTATGGAGGLTGAGTGTRLGASGQTGGQGLSYNSNDLNNAYSDWTGSAKVLIYKYL